MALEHAPRGADWERVGATVSRARRLLTEPLLPVLVLAPVALFAAAQNATGLCWAALAALAGYSLSGSV
jgi:hypothetical protein